MIKEGGNIRLWDQEVLAEAIIQYTQLALQLANLTATSCATLHSRADPYRKTCPYRKQEGPP